MTSLALVGPAPSPTAAALAQLQDLRTELAQPLELADAMAAVKRSEAIRHWARVARLGAVVSFEAGEVLLRSQRTAGNLLLEYIAAAGTTTYHHAGGERTQARGTLPKRSLERLGLTPKQSSNWQAIARLPSDEFEVRIEACRQAGRAPSSEAFLRAAHRFLLPKRTRVTPALTLLRKAAQALREVQHAQLSTRAEFASAQHIARLATSLMTQLDDEARLRTRPDAVARSTTCIMCGRGQPSTQPPRCPACGGAWFQS